MTKLWGSRFSKGTDKLADEFSFSLAYDGQLAIYDVVGSIAHAKMLGKCKIISQKDALQIIKGLKKIGEKIEKGHFTFDPNLEDVHTCIQVALKNEIGEAADKLHTARSRNDLIVLDMKLYCMAQLVTLIDLIKNLQKSIIDLAQKNQEVIIPAYTHLQSAQVVLLAHHLLAYVEMLERDKSRLGDAFDRTDVMPLGSCALSGTSLPTDREFLAKELGFVATTQNSMDAVSDRDFIVEILSGLAILGVHCSRFSEDIILWSTKEFNFASVDGAFCTGSSIMPHKKNPDILELIRGESAKLISNLNEVLVLLKGLPLTYNRDLQLDKPPLFESIKTVKKELVLLTKIFTSLTINKEKIAERTQDEALFSVDVMEYLIKKGVSYRQAHDIVGSMVRECLDQDKKITDLTEAQLKAYCPKFDIGVKKLLNPLTSVTIKKSLGSTNPKLVDAQIKKWKKTLSS